MTNDEQTSGFQLGFDGVHDQPFLGKIEIDQYVPQESHIERSHARQGLAEIGLREGNPLPDRSTHEEEAIVPVLTLETESPQEILRDCRGAFHGVEPLARALKHSSADIRPLNPPVSAAEEV